MVKKAKVNEYDKQLMRTGMTVLLTIGAVGVLVGLMIGKIIWG